MIYLDSAATTRPYNEVIDAVTNVLHDDWANPSSNYSIAHSAKTQIEHTRMQFAIDMNCDQSEIIFTSSGCESNSLAIAGFLMGRSDYDLFTSCLEHASINEMVEKLPRMVGRVNIPVDAVGQISPDTLRSLIIERQKYSNRKPFVSISGASSEVGVIQDIKALADVVHQYNGIIHCDAVQLFPEIRMNVKDLGVDMLSISAQKFHGIRGAGVLYVRDGIELAPIIYGSQEDHRRGGSYNTAAIIGMGVALAITRLFNKKTYVKALRDRMLDKLLQIPGARLNGPKIHCNRLVNNISLTIDGVSAERLVTLCDMFGVIIARGSACKSYEPTPSQALLGIGLTHEQALSTIRITLDEFITEADVDQAAEIITKMVERIRNSE